MVRPDKRESLIQAAGVLFHRKGLEHTSLADIAGEAGVPLGNVYYYFKTRSDLLKAVTEGRIATARALRAGLERIADPRERLLAYVDGWEARTEELTAHGCPIGGLCIEANKQGGPMAEDAASVLREILDWVGAQFRALGYPAREAKELAARMMGARHGSILLANTFKDPGYIRKESARIKAWLKELPTGGRRRMK